MNLKLLAICGALLAMLSAVPNEAQAPKPDSKALAATGILDRLAERSGVYGVPSTAKVPGFIAGPRSFPTTGSSDRSEVFMSRPTTTSGSINDHAR
jgi:hypothetical protein